MSKIQEVAPLMQKFPALVRAARVRSGMTNEDLAKASGVSYSVVCKIQSGERIPKMDDGIAVMKALGLSADEHFAVPRTEQTPDAARDKIHALELNNAAYTADVQRLTEINTLISAQLEDEKRRGRYHRRWAAGASVLAAILSLIVSAYLIFDLRVPDAGLIRQGAFSAGAYLIALLVVVVLAGSCFLAYRSLCEFAMRSKLKDETFV